MEKKMDGVKIEEFQSLKLNDEVKETAKIYSKVAAVAEKLVNSSYEAEGKKVEFPIDMNLITKYLGMKVEKGNLNDEKTERFSRILGVITSHNGSASVVIDNGVSYKTQRYAIANAVGRYLLNQSKPILKCNYAIPLIPQSLEEISADVIALFLLLPVKCFKEEFLHYLEKCENHPMDVDDWLRHLENVSQISLFNLSIGYQQMKQILCYQRQSEFEENHFNMNIFENDPYDIIYA